jgi:hypothetical protein
MAASRFGYSASIFTPVERLSLRAPGVGMVISAVALLGLCIELSRPTSPIGWALRNVHDTIHPARDVVPGTGILSRLSVTEADIDIMVRTIIGEAANEPDIGKVAVAWVILTRASQNVSWYGGNSVTSVAMHKSSTFRNGRIKIVWQFEPWMSRRVYLWNISKRSSLYVHVKTLVEGCLNGTHADPTDGATHFLEPDVVRARTGGTLPKWAQGEGRRIGRHVFFKHEQPII